MSYNRCSGFYLEIGIKKSYKWLLVVLYVFRQPKHIQRYNIFGVCVQFWDKKMLNCIIWRFYGGCVEKTASSQIEIRPFAMYRVLYPDSVAGRGLLRCPFGVGELLELVKGQCLLVKGNKGLDYVEEFAVGYIFAYAAAVVLVF